MGTNAIIAAIDKELARLQQIRALLLQKGNGAAPAIKTASGAVGKKRNRLSPAARARIAEAQRKRWAAVRKNAKG